jgi:NAD(P)H-dependent flavin oxidoreductase YrpB (nitropropane dioxygenase family)
MGLSTAVCSLFGIRHPVLLGGMAGASTPALTAQISLAGGLGIHGCSFQPPLQIEAWADEIRRLSDRPFGLNLLPFGADATQVDAVLAARPAVLSTGWAFPDQDLRTLFARAHDVGSKVLHMVSSLPEALRAADAGADAIVAQGTEGGGHVGVMGTMTLVPMVVRAVRPVPVVAAGGIADGAGLAAALMLGADGVLLGTRFLATPESPLPESFKRTIVESDGHNTLLTEIPDLINGRVWPGAYSRVARNRLIEEWLGREGALRYRRREVVARVQAAREQGNVDQSILYIGETAGLIDALLPAATVVEQVVQEAEALLRGRSAAVLA